MSSHGNRKMTNAARSRAGLIPCPACSKLVPLQTINMHLDTSCRPPASAPTAAASHSRIEPVGPGLNTPAVSEATTGHPDGGVRSQMGHGDETSAAAPSEPSPKRRRITSESHRELRQDATDGSSAPRLATTDAAEERESGAGQATLESPDCELRLLEDSFGAAATEQQAASPPEPQLDREPADAQHHSGHEREQDYRLPDEEQAASQANHITAERESQQQQASKLPANPLGRLMQARHRQRLPGHFLFERFISEQEESDLLAFLDTCEPAWSLSTFNGPHRGKAWGVRMDLKRRTVSEPLYPMPDLLMALAERMRSLPPLQTFFPNEANANDYKPAEGMYLGPHVDDRQLSTGAIVTLSLASAAVMSFQKDQQLNSPKARVFLPPGSLQVLTKDARYSYTHAIDPNDFHGIRRVSVTFRQSPLRR